MKYSKEHPPLVCMQTNSRCYKNTRIMNVKGVLVHSTGANNPTIKRYVQPINDPEMLAIIGKNPYNNDYNHQPNAQAGLNAFIGKLANSTVAAVQTMPWNYRPWGCGSGSKGSCNDGWIQFEICEDNLQDTNYFNAIYKETMELVAYLCKLYGLNPLGQVQHNGVAVPVILCHKDSNTLKLGSAHADVLHWFPKFGKNMDTLRQDVYALMNEKEEEEVTQEDFEKMMAVYLKKLAAEQATQPWEINALAWAQQNGILQGGGDGNLMPHKFITRGEMATVLQRYDEKK